MKKGNIFAKIPKILNKDRGTGVDNLQRVEEVQGTDYIITYFVYFIVDQDGIWRILRF